MQPVRKAYYACGTSRDALHPWPLALSTSADRRDANADPDDFGDWHTLTFRLERSDDGKADKTTYKTTRMGLLPAALETYVDYDWEKQSSDDGKEICPDLSGLKSPSTIYRAGDLLYDLSFEVDMEPGSITSTGSAMPKDIQISMHSNVWRAIERKVFAPSGRASYEEDGAGFGWKMLAKNTLGEMSYPVTVLAGGSNCEGKMTVKGRFSLYERPVHVADPDIE